MSVNSYGNYLGINGLGRIGKLTLWYHLQENYFDGFVINVGRQIGIIIKEEMNKSNREKVKEIFLTMLLT